MIHRTVDPVPGFASFWDRIEGNGVRTVIVEGCQPLCARADGQELGITLLISRGVQLLEGASGLQAAPRPRARPPRRGSVKGASRMGSCAEAVALAKRLHRASPKTGKRMSLRKIAAALTEAGHLNERGQPFNPKSIVAMVAQKTST